ncbi:S26 family signal peptidase [Micromonospora sp. C28SCA-DRY-2]|uniref:S26 family signal peptidase n=1 Tax=Micromonospora sp. C28SCA-DRY-2 TaxID=3059522 RepID=UPI002677556B|nr:S26 family signal peptidase [Micromonospora sp. C28SCA-DRY-2]MDO3703193.1 S26 family signal peptidase [Micromonospora sp. C28SCA-DRY-2]
MILACGGAATLLAVVLVGRWLRRRFLVVTVEGRSMEPGHRDGDRVLVDRLRSATVRVGDVVVVDRDGVPDRPDRPMIKRVAALPGEPVPVEVCAFQHWPIRTRVPPGQLVLLGDNPAGSLDSRQRGFFPADRLLGVVVRQLRRDR